MARSALLIKLLAGVLGIASVPVAAVQAAEPSVVAVDGTLCDIAQTVVGPAANVTCLIPPGGDPHGYRLKPSDRKAIATSALVVHIGFGLTPAAEAITSPGSVVAVGEQALPNYNGDDPHVWHDPSNSAAMVSALSNALLPVLPASDRDDLKRRSDAAIAVLNDLGRWGAIQFETLSQPQRVIVTDHKTYSHLADRYGVSEIAMLDSYTTGGVLRPSSLRRISEEIKSSGAKVIFTPSIPPNKTLRRISKSTGLPIASTPLFGEGTAAGETAVSTATINICTMVEGQGGRCDEASADALNDRWQAIR